MMLIDNYNRRINYLRVSLSNNCNLRCFYCISKTHKLENNYNTLSKDEIFRLLKIAVSLGIDKIRLTGGEPLLREDIVDIVRCVSSISGVNDLSLTTNGVLLSSFAKKLKDAGLKRINISLDTLNPDKFKIITSGGNIDSVLEGIKCAQSVGFEPIKINVVVLRGINDDEIINFINFGKQQNIIIRFIELMPTTKSETLNKKFFSKEEILKIINAKMSFEWVNTDGSTEYYFQDEKKIFGVISPITCSFCETCNRLRLTSDGKLLVCLTNNYYVDLGNYIKEGKNDEEIKDAFLRSVKLKPKKGYFTQEYQIPMWQIGG